jgi:hypothetical protein
LECGRPVPFFIFYFLLLFRSDNRWQRHGYSMYELEVGFEHDSSNINELIQIIEKANNLVDLIFEKLMYNKWHQSLRDSKYLEKINNVESSFEAANVTILEISALYVQLNHDLEEMQLH